MKGGSAIASGGFGCVFDPSIKCKNKNRLKNHVSKLLFNKYANSEINEVKKFIKDIKSIKNFHLYFIIPENVCNPSNLTNEDKKSFDKKCFSLTKNNITSANINSNLDKLKIIQLEKGGIDMDEYFNKEPISPLKFIKINKLLLNLLYNGILKMNKKKIYHMDIKNSNILIKDEKLIRLIDWGLSEKINNEIPIQIKYRPLHYNMPYSIILFNDLMIQKINYYLQNNNSNHLNKLTDFLERTYNNTFVENIGKHHDDLIHFILSNYIHPNKDSKKIIFQYLAEIVNHFSVNNRFNVEKYFNTVYLKNCDVWGFFSVYLLLIIDSLHNIILSPIRKEEFKNKIVNIFKEYILKYSYKAIPIKQMIKELLKLNNIFSITIQNERKTLKNKKTTNSFNKNSYQYLLTKEELTEKVKNKSRKNRTFSKKITRKKKQY